MRELQDLTIGELKAIITDCTAVLVDKSVTNAIDFIEYLRHCVHVKAGGQLLGDANVIEHNIIGYYQQ